MDITMSRYLQGWARAYKGIKPALVEEGISILGLLTVQRRRRSYTEFIQQ